MFLILLSPFLTDSEGEPGPTSLPRQLNIRHGADIGRANAMRVGREPFFLCLEVGGPPRSSNRHSVELVGEPSKLRHGPVERKPSILGSNAEYSVDLVVRLALDRILDPEFHFSCGMRRQRL